MKERNEDVHYRELFSELSETPIHPLLIHIVPPFIEESNPTFHLQINGEVVWKWREVCWPPRKVFNLLQASILPLGYRLAESACERVGPAIAESIRRFRRKIETISNGKKRKEVRAEIWIKFAIHPEEIEQSPRDVTAQLTEKYNGLRSTEALLAGHIH